MTQERHSGLLLFPTATRWHQKQTLPCRSRREISFEHNVGCFDVTTNTAGIVHSLCAKTEPQRIASEAKGVRGQSHSSNSYPRILSRQVHQHDSNNAWHRPEWHKRTATRSLDAERAKMLFGKANCKLKTR